MMTYSNKHYFIIHFLLLYSRILYYFNVYLVITTILCYMYIFIVFVPLHTSRVISGMNVVVTFSNVFPCCVYLEFGTIGLCLLLECFHV